MKRFLKYVLYFFIIIIVIPILCTKNSIAIKENEKQNIQNNTSEIKKENSLYDYGQYSKIKLFHQETEQVEEINFDEYLYGTVSAEMPASYEDEALKAQAVVSRTYTIYQILNNKSKHGEANICDDSSCCQAWISKDNRLSKWNEDSREKNWNKIVEAVNNTSGKIITYDSKPINAFFHSNSGGITETVSNVWGGKDLPYLQSVETSGETEYSQYNSEVKLTKDELNEKMKKEYSDFSIDWNSEKNAIEIIEYTISKRVKTIKIGNQKIAGTKARSLFGLKSTNFVVTIENNNIIFSVIGYGHGVGMSQTGADSMAKSGSNYEEIIKHFYSGVEIINFQK